MLKQTLYFRPEYVERFKCDGSKCNARCCKGWKIFIDDYTYKKYSQFELQDIIKHIKFDENFGEYCVTLDERNFCPFLTEKNLCRIQLEHGEDFLSLVCATYPRRTIDFGQFYERALFLTCPVAAEMALFEQEPMKFELSQVPETFLLIGGRLGTSKVNYTDNFAERMIEIQIAMISILQERTLTIDQRLIVLGFFLDKLEEIIGDGKFLAEQVPGLIDNLHKLIAAYESKNFLAEQVPLMLSTVRFDTQKFIKLMLGIFETLYANTYFGDEQKFIDAVVDTLALKPDEKNFVSVKAVAATYERLAEERKKFLAQYATFLENYLVNELFINTYPWRFENTVTKNFAAFVTAYKVFELLMFSATCKGLDTRAELLQLVSWFLSQVDHNKYLMQKIFDCANQQDDLPALMDSLLIGF